MKRNLYGRISVALMLFVVMASTVSLALVGHLKTRRRPPAAIEGSNPNAFFVWGTMASYQYTFTYDPHAADTWLFQSGGGKLIQGTNVVPTSKPKWAWKN